MVRRMTGFLLRRIGMSVLLLWIIATMLFFFIHILPGDPAEIILGGSDSFIPSQAQLERVREQLGLNRPILVQYAEYLSGLFRGNLGHSFVNGRPVALDVGLRLTRTTQLIIPAIVLSSIIGILIGVIAARSRSRLVDFGLTATALVGFSLPSFVTGYLLVLAFSLGLGWLPASGYTDLGANPLGWLRYATLPIIALSLGPIASTMRMTRTSVMEHLNQDYVRTARAIGASERSVTYRHVLRNALLPVVTIIGLQFGGMFAGSVVIESVFNWPGLSTLLVRSVGARDYPVILGALLISSVIFLTVNLLTDIMYAVLNPKLRHA